MNIDKLTPEEFNALLDKMPDDVKKAFAHLYWKNPENSPIKDIKGWVKDYDHNCPIDRLLSVAIHEFLFTAGHEIQEDMKQNKDAGKDEYFGGFAVEIASKVLLKIADRMKAAGDRYNKGNH